MSEIPPVPEDQIPGYASEASKRRFTITAGILGTVFLIAQFVLPMAFMMGLMWTAPTFDIDFTDRHPHHAAVWDGGVWLVETEPGFDDPDTSALVRTDLDGTSASETMAGPLDGKPYLLAGEDRLWLITQNGLAYFQDGRVVTTEQPKMLADFSLPFLVDGRPAALERWPTELALMVHDGASWQPRATLPIVMPDPECGCGLDWAKAVADERGIHLFLEFGTTLYYGLWKPDSEDAIQWELVGEAGRDSAPVTWQGEPTAIGVTAKEDGGNLIGRRRGGDGWSEVLRLDEFSDALVSAHAGPSPGSLIVLVGSGHSSSVAMLEIDGEGNVAQSWIGEEPTETDPVPDVMWVMMAVQYGSILVLPLILAVILSMMMRRHRVTAYSSGPREGSFASLTRRAVAQLVDLVIIAGPMIASTLLFMRRTWTGEMGEPDGLWEVVVFMGPVLTGMGWALALALLFTFTEGRSGVTPGKWAASIRVLGTDLQPCGFGRALVRNLLKCVDGFFNFMVGIMVVALSENWQRVGDMAARTVVVDWRD